MTIDTWYLYIGTVLLLMSTPGPSQLLMLANSLSSGLPRSAMTAAGDLTANLLQMLVAISGLSYLIESHEKAVVVIQWFGVSILLYLGTRSLIERRPLHVQGAHEEKRKSGRALYVQGFFVSVVNPKAVVFFAALFPQFIDPAGGVGLQFAILSSTYLLLDGLFLMAYAVLAVRLAGWVASHDGMMLRCGPGVLLSVVAVGLAVKAL
ncbi:LysE family translocator [Halomonas eurihalina]|uniref:LysE family translocator n=1 Tax=Halomonas eurihalina TaxID=42566 RepID=A0A5D9D9S4_HALER|nr:LysE family translocator [Halomonas eurihalina]MDR5860575.1 LysE family translocator [Halomonas eurihalina]TZG40193.1 LysE family translocator [Halomonas eurihalina]